MWKNTLSNLTNSLPDASKLNKSFTQLQQSVKETIGRTDNDAITELPDEYKQLERQCDALRDAHNAMIKITKVYATESYDYPTNINESVSELGANVSHSLSFWANQAAKTSNLPVKMPQPGDKPVEVKKTLSHALSRAAAGASLELADSDERLAKSLKSYAVAQDKIASYRMASDSAITNNFTKPWQVVLNTKIQAATKARQNVKSARLSLDANRAKHKLLSQSSGAAGGSAQKSEQARLDVEQAEEVLVTSTEQAIDLMRNVLDSPESVKALEALVKAQQEYHTRSAEALSEILTSISEASVQAEVDYRKSRA